MENKLCGLKPFISIFILYVYVILLTSIVIHQIKQLRVTDVATDKLVIKLNESQSKIDIAHKHMEQALKNDAIRQEQLQIMLKILEHEQAESDKLEAILKRSK